MHYSPAPSIPLQDFIDLYLPMGYSRDLIVNCYKKHSGSPNLAQEIQESLLESTYAFT